MNARQAKRKFVNEQLAYLSDKDIYQPIYEVAERLCMLIHSLICLEDMQEPEFHEHHLATHKKTFRLEISKQPGFIFEALSLIDEYCSIERHWLIAAKVHLELERELFPGKPQIH